MSACLDSSCVKPALVNCHRCVDDVWTFIVIGLAYLCFKHRAAGPEPVKSQEAQLALRCSFHR